MALIDVWTVDSRVPIQLFRDRIEE